MTKFSISFAGIDPINLLGPADENLDAISQGFHAQVTARGDRIRVTVDDEESEQLKELLLDLVKQAKRGIIVTPELIRHALGRGGPPCDERTRAVEIAGSESPAVNRPRIVGDEPPRSSESTRRTENGVSSLIISTPRIAVRPKTNHQIDYVRAIDQNEITIAIGPAGTGKTYLAVAKAVSALVTGKVARIVLTRPAVEAGESLGFLPGGLKEKVDPYLRPLFDALYDMLYVERMKRLVDEQVVEVAPLAYMRGRTLSDAFVILDEAQNTTSAQMKMFLTRLGWNSKAVVTGDITQIDLDHRQSSGLVEVQHKLRDVPGIKFCLMDDTDVVRPPIVAEIIRAYERKLGRQDETTSI